ncbi:CPBP family intramembrane glutamic endopeptidase [Nostoc sp. UHCC 0251]|uniref:CPBP family intramembrane glutamic endopeptidase n=1 Tax=Nostoc sp. UHCC 0251 TaxID=3110240 RepID=UPI002B216A15|nr:CPBP family intramembrane glutamic endopeptidase [Nostoc sp. UHCC 0251]MEA5624365.1 CPBP family intramembrane glutamic endopeptidase [Nostoc sp. UHCC 0251]
MVKKFISQNSFTSAIAWVTLIILAEYVARRFVAYWLPLLAAERVNDMLSIILCYVLLVWFTVPKAQRNVGRVSQVIHDILAQAKTWLPWVGTAVILLSINLLSPLDQWLWGKVQLPGWQSPSLDPPLFPQAAPVLIVTSMLLVNGIFVPIAEEWLWRGLIQPRLMKQLGFASGLLLTAVLFSLKHVIVDASLGRLLFLTFFGVVVGIIARRKGWESAALTHTLVNSISTVLFFLIFRK